MESIIEQVKIVIGLAINVIKSQADRITALKAELSAAVENYDQFAAAEVEEDAAADALLAQLEEIAGTLSTTIDEAQATP